MMYGSGVCRGALPRADRRCSGIEPADQRLPQRGEGEEAARVAS